MELTFNKITIVKGEDRTLQLGILEPNGNPYDLTGATEIIVGLENDDGTFLQLKYTESKVSIVQAKAGTISATITATQSALLKAGNSMDFHAKITISSAVRKAIFEGLLNVIEKTF